MSAISCGRRRLCVQEIRNLFSMSQVQRVLGLFAKEPRPGQVKTRLAAATSLAWAARVADAFLRDQLERLARIPARLVLAFTPASARPFFESVSGSFALTPQVEGDLGQRMRAFFEQQLAGGADAIVLLGTDSPTVPLAFVEQAFRELKQADLVLGPATDGGYYLIGIGRRLPPIFEGVAWSTRRVLAETIERLDDPAWRLALLPPWYDVDTLDDWNLLRGHLAALQRAGHAIDVPHTHALLNAPDEERS